MPNQYCWFDSTGAVTEVVAATWDFSNGALPTLYPLPTGQPVNLDLLSAPNESDEELCRIPQLPSSRYDGYASTAFPVAFDNLLPDQNVGVATIPIDWDDHEGDPANLPAKNKQVQIFMDFYETASQGALTFTPTFADRWYRLPESVSDYPQRQVSDFNQKLAQHGIDAADGDLDFSQIDIVVFIFPIAPPIIAGVPPSPLEFATLQNFNMTGPTNEQWVSSDEGGVRNYMGGGMYFEHPLRPIWSYYFHEAAHMFDMPDYYMHEANAVLGSQQVIDVDYAIGPLNVWGVMSTQDGPSRTFVAWTRWLLGWLEDEQVDCYTIEQVQQHGSFDTELVALDIYEPGTKAIIIRTDEYCGLLIESRRPVFPDDYLAVWEAVGRDPYGLIVYEIDATKRDGTGTLIAVTPDGHGFKHMQLHGRQQPKLVDALFNVGNTATVQGVEIELLFTGDRDFVRISTASTTTPTTTCRTLAEAEAALEAEAGAAAAAGSFGPDPADAGCGSFDSQAEAQEFFEANPESGPGLDTNGDGIACGAEDPGGEMDCGDGTTELGHRCWFSLTFTCGRFDTQAEAQTWLDSAPDDPGVVDENGDGIACGEGDWGGITTCGDGSVQLARLCSWD
jgi:M6 family metalloprotease-like protein